MKKIIALLVFFSVVLLAGCANDLGVGPVGPTSGETAVVKMNIVLEKPNVILAKSTAIASIDVPTKLFVTLLPDYKYDTISLTGGPVTLKYLLKKGGDYQLLLGASNPVESPNYNLNMASPSFHVPNQDTFSLDVVMPAYVAKLDAKIPLKGSQVATSANSVKIVWTNESYSDSSFIAFTPGSLDTAKLVGLMGTRHNYTVTVTINCADGSYYKGTGSVNLATSVDSNLDILLTKYDSNGAVILTSITLSKVAVVAVKVVWP